MHSTKRFWLSENSSSVGHQTRQTEHAQRQQAPFRSTVSGGEESQTPGNGQPPDVASAVPDAARGLRQTNTRWQLLSCLRLLGMSWSPQMPAPCTTSAPRGGWYTENRPQVHRHRCTTHRHTHIALLTALAVCLSTGGTLQRLNAGDVPIPGTNTPTHTHSLTHSLTHQYNTGATPNHINASSNITPRFTRDPIFLHTHALRHSHCGQACCECPTCHPRKQGTESYSSCCSV